MNASSGAADLPCQCQDWSARSSSSSHALCSDTREVSYSHVSSSGNSLGIPKLGYTYSSRLMRVSHAQILIRLLRLTVPVAGMAKFKPRVCSLIAVTSILTLAGAGSMGSIQWT